MKTPTGYIVASKPRGTLYAGVTSNLARRIWEHREGAIDGFSARHRVRRLVWYERRETMLGAIAREKLLKRWSRPWKFELIHTMNPKWRDLWPDIIGCTRASTPAH